MMAEITTVQSVRPLGNNLSVVTVQVHTEDGPVEYEVVANRTENGSFRWSVHEPVVYISEGVIVPDDVLKERGYWNDEKNIGLLEGKKGNRVKMRRFGPEDDRVESRGLLFKVEDSHMLFNDRGITSEVFPVRRGDKLTTDVFDINLILMGSGVGEFLGLTEHNAG